MLKDWFKMAKKISTIRVKVWQLVDSTENALARSHRQNPTLFFGAILCGSCATGMWFLHLVETAQKSNQRERPVAEISDDLKSRNETFALMLRDLKSKTREEKLAAAGVAADKFFEPQFSSMVTSISPK